MRAVHPCQRRWPDPAPQLAAWGGEEAPGSCFDRPSRGVPEDPVQILVLVEPSWVTSLPSRTSASCSAPSQTWDVSFSLSLACVL